MNETNITASMCRRSVRLRQSKGKSEGYSDDGLHGMQALLMQCPNQTLEKSDVKKEFKVVEKGTETKRKGNQCENDTKKRLLAKVIERSNKIHSIDINKNKTSGKSKLKSKKSSGKKKKGKKEKIISDKLVELDNVIYILDDRKKELDKSFLQTLDTITMISNDDNEDDDVDVDYTTVDVSVQTDADDVSLTPPVKRNVYVSVENGMVKSEFYQPICSGTRKSFPNKFDFLNVGDIISPTTSACKQNTSVDNTDKDDKTENKSSNFLFIRHLKDTMTCIKSETGEVTPVTFVANLTQVAKRATKTDTVNQIDSENSMKSMLPLNSIYTKYQAHSSAEMCGQISDGRIVLPRIDDKCIFTNISNCVMCRQQMKNLVGIRTDM